MRAGYLVDVSDVSDVIDVSDVSDVSDVILSLVVADEIAVFVKLHVDAVG